MAIYGLKPRFRASLRAVERRLIGWGVSADAITWMGLVFAGLAGLGIWLGRDGSAWLLLVPAGAFLRTAANALDGMVAQTTGTARPLGEVLNETADRLGDVAVVLPVMTVPDVPPALVAGALAAALVSSSLGLAARAAGGPRLYGGLMGKPDRMLVVSLAAIAAWVWEPALVFTIALWVVLAGGLVTMAQRTRAARRALRS